MQKTKNGTKLPEDLVQKMIDFSSKPGDVVFDPFMGNGTSGIVAKKTIVIILALRLTHKQ
ncbi:MAG: DNA methyltransferase [Promethearchaeota archaeon]